MCVCVYFYVLLGLLVNCIYINIGFLNSIIRE